jgi:hypothetical protein
MTVIKSTMSQAEAKEVLRTVTKVAGELTIGDCANVWASMAANTISVACAAGMSRETALHDFIDTLLAYLKGYEEKFGDMTYEEMKFRWEASPWAN